MKQPDRTTLLDVTLRDGGYVNQHSWTIEQAVRVVRTCASARIPFTEVGYLRPRRHRVDGAEAPAASCPPHYLDGLQEVAGSTGVTVMAHVKDTEPKDLARLADHGVRLVRVPTRPDRVERLAPYVAAAHEAGLEFAVNVIRVSELEDETVLAAAAAAAALDADIFYLADSNGSLFPEDVARLAAKVQHESGLTLGFHPHDGISMGFSNALAAMREGFTYVDASLAGMGKGGGNLALELVASYLRAHRGQDLVVSPLVETSADLLAPWKGADLRAQFESVASGLLDLNLDALEEITRESPEGLLALIDGTTSTR
ncbi:hypothetical protein [Kitasatospora sp. NPDC093806]|uniref:hypothetical protein n=1 Tax=Kitasatospora sp. NPDC093806 TaxID=3155075 RepID=UPI00343CD3D8